MQRYHKLGADSNIGSEHHDNSIRIVHISDTHLCHDELIQNNCIPNGDILVHSGDFLKNEPDRPESLKSGCFNDIQAIDKFFKGLPHKHKIFIAGNHEVSFTKEDPEWIANQFQNCIYLQDSSVVLYGVKFYGTPWTGLRQGSAALAFTAPFSDLHKFWALIPDDVDVLVSHSPPHGVMDLGLDAAHLRHIEKFCTLCHTSHQGMSHFGCQFLKNELTVRHRIRPRLHLFGHAHEDCGTKLIDGMLFSNAATPVQQVATVIDLSI